MKIFKIRDLKFPIAMSFNDDTVQKLTINAARELSKELLKILDEPFLQFDVRTIHRKTGNEYWMSKNQIINCTNKDDGETMVLYTDRKSIFTREKSEFFDKFDIMV